MPEPNCCPVCKTPVPATEESQADCASCDAKLAVGDDGGWVLAGDAPAG